MAGALSRRWLDGARDGVSSAISMGPDDAVVGRRLRDSRTMVPMVAGRRSRRLPFGDLDVPVRHDGWTTLAMVVPTVVG